MSDADDGRSSHNGRDALAEIIAAQRDEGITAQDLVIAAVRQAIMAGVLEPRARLRQEELAEVFGTSRIPVREALRALEYEGLVTSEPRRGFTVAALDADDVEEVYDLRVLLESHAVRLLVPVLTESDVGELDALFEAMQTADTPDGQLAARERFYLRLYSISGRPRLAGLIMRLRQEVARALRWGTIQHSASVHQAFWEAVRAGDTERATAQLANHYRRVSALIRRHLKEAEARSRSDRSNSRLFS